MDNSDIKNLVKRLFVYKIRRPSCKRCLLLQPFEDPHSIIFYWNFPPYRKILLTSPGLRRLLSKGLLDLLGWQAQSIAIINRYFSQFSVPF